MWNKTFKICKPKSAIKLLVVLAMLASLYSCTKPEGGFYHYENKVHIYKGNALQFLQSKPNLYDSFLVVLSRFPDLEDSVKNDEVTVLAPTNKSFESALQNLNSIRQTQGKPSLTLMTLDSTQLDTIVSRYILREKITTDDVVPYVDGIPAYGLKYGIKMNLQYKKTSASGANLSGPQLLYVSDTKGSPYIKYWIRTTTASVNLFTDNGIIHTLTSSHEFGFGEFSTRLNK